MNDHKQQLQIEEILSTIQQIASGNFSNRAPVYGKEDRIDALAVGINMLGEEIEARIVSQQQHSKEINELATRLSAITSSAQDAIILMDPNKKVSFWNPAAEKMFGYTQEEILNKNLHKILAPKRFYTSFEAGFADFKKYGTGNAVNRTVELSAIKKSGQEFPVQLSLSVAKLAGEWNAVGIIRDITEQKLAEEKLRRSEEKYRTIIENIEDGYFEVDLAGKFTFFNKSLQKQFGYTKKELMGMGNRDYMGAEDAKRVFKKFNIVYKTGKPANNVNWIFIRKDGDKRIAESSISLIHDVNGNPCGFRGIVRDETARIKAKEALEKSEERYRILTEELSASNNMKELLIDVITHDIKNPAGVIQVMSEMISEVQTDNEEIQLIRKSSENLLNTIQDATTLAQVTLDRDIKKETVDLRKIIQDIVLEFSSSYTEAGLVLENKITEPLIIQANPIIKEVFHNYISNARKYARAGKKVIIECQTSAETVTINVKDFGTTISEMDRARIFDRKIQLDKDKKTGRGLGLAIVKRIAEAHSADAGVKPNRLSGNIFYLKIPVQ